MRTPGISLATPRCRAPRRPAQPASVPAPAPDGAAPIRPPGRTLPLLRRASRYMAQMSGAGGSVSIMGTPQPPPGLNSCHANPCRERICATELDELGGGYRVILRLVDLRADVHVQANQRQPRRPHGCHDGALGVAGLDVESELGVHLAGLDVRVRVRLYAGRKPQPDANWKLEAGSSMSLATNSVSSANWWKLSTTIRPMPASSACAARQTTCCCRESGRAQQKASLQRHVQLAAGDDVQVKTFFLEELHDRQAQVGFGGVGGLRRSRIVPPSASW